MPPMNAAPVVPLFDSHCGGSLAVQLDSPMEGLPSENEYAKSVAPTVAVTISSTSTPVSGER